MFAIDICSIVQRTSSLTVLKARRIGKNAKYRYSLRERYCVTKSNNRELLFSMGNIKAQKTTELKCKDTTQLVRRELFI